jgi:leucyl aminopeptidase
MRPVYEIPLFSTPTAPPRDLDVDLLAVPCFEDRTIAAWDELDVAAGGELRAALSRGEFNAKAYELFVTRPVAKGWRASRLVAVGGGPSAETTVERLRRMAASVGLLARQQRLARVAWVTDPADDGAVQAVADGLTQANFDAGAYKSRDATPFFLSHVALAGCGEQRMTAIERGCIVGEAVNAARVLINEPSNRLTPRDLVERAAALAAVPGVRSEILDEREIEALGMGLLLGVARGSAEPPRLLVLRYEPPGAPLTPVLGLVGKGITFDTGGISLKPADGMERMKDDMAGGAAVTAALRAIARQKVALNVVAVVPCTENMPGGRALKPGDVLRGAAGLTVEVNNTDAEGRLILGDGLWYAEQRLGATHLVDVATLTGACVVALGKVTTGLFGSPDAWVSQVRHAADLAGERAWALPLFDEYRESLKSEIADMINSPGRPAGAITAAMFLKEFVGGRPWAHLDIAGTAWAEESKAWAPKGATGVTVATLVELARELARQS